MRVPQAGYPLAFVTGTTSGIGEALARDLLGRGWHVAGVARRAASIADDHYAHFRLDLRDLTALSTLLESHILPLVTDRAVSRLGLVNNGAMEALLGPVSMLDAMALPAVYAVNTAAPILLMGWFHRRARPGQPLRIVNVSTGAAVIPLPGLGAYGHTKAALRMAGRIMAAELEAAPASAAQPDTTILSYEPGLVDTPMQTAVRTSPVEVMPIVQVFKDYAASGALVPPTLPARVIADYLDSDEHPRWAEHRFDPQPQPEDDG